MLIPPKILEDAAEPARELFRTALKRVPAIYKPLMKTAKAGFLDPELDMKSLWVEHGLNEKNHSKGLTRALGGVPLWTFTRKRRTETAARLLEDKRIATTPLYVLALATGFKSSSALNAAFKVWSHGVPPADYRKARLAEAPMRPQGGLEELRLPRPRTILRETLRDAYRLTMRDACNDAAFDNALGKLREASAMAEHHALGDLAGEVAAYRALVYHCRGVVHTMELDIDGAYADLAVAHSYYTASPPLPKLIQRARARLLYSDDTKFFLLKELCVPCQAGLMGEEGHVMHEHLNRALYPVPRDLDWFQVCCDECYRIVWNAIDKARLGLVSDVWKAAWLAGHADPAEDTPPSLGRYIRALHDSENLTYQGQRQRLDLSRLAVETARSLNDPLRESYARCFEANALRTLGRLQEARYTLEAASERCQENQWTAAFLAGMEGQLAVQERNRQQALASLRRAAALYSRLDPHTVGFVLIAQGELFFDEQNYEAAYRSLDEALTALDYRRNPLLANGGVPLNLAATLGALSRPEAARKVLGRCEFDRSIYRGLAATELFVTGCLELEEGRPEEALRFFQEAATLNESLDRLRDKALASSYSVEAYARLGNSEKALESAAEALRLFQKLGCKQDVIEAFAKLRQQLEAAVIDAVGVAVSVRRFARAQGGWLPQGMAPSA